MDYLERLNEAGKRPIVYYHRFISSYRDDSTDIYVFCEGDVDLSYYCEQIERLVPGREIHKYPAECKNNVLQIWRNIDWDCFQKNRVLFFVDRDLSYWLGDPQYYDTNVYITDGYSFENDAINELTFLKLLEDLYGFANYSSYEKDYIRTFYIKQWKKFEDGSYVLMGYILYKYLLSHEHMAKNISMHQCLSVGTNQVWKNCIKGEPCEDYYKKQLKLGEEDLTESIKELKKRFIDEKEHYSIRGKWCLDFLIDLMNYIYNSGEHFAASLYEGSTKKPKKIIELTSRGAMAIIGPRIVAPESLNSFLTANLM